MRLLFALIVAANLVVFAIGRGWLGTPPEAEGRNPERAARQLNPDAARIQPGKVER